MTAIKKKIMMGVLATGIFAAGVTLSNSFLVNTASVKPGTVNDPVVTKSYVDEQIAKLSGNSSVGAGPSSQATLEVVTVPVGKTLMVKAGSEVVIRAGKAVAYSSDSNGLSDVTAGADIKSGASVPANHLIWFPRDGRGIQVSPDSSGALTVLVKGPYTIE